MVDEENPAEMAHFAFTKEAIAGRRRMRIKYRDVAIELSWPNTPEGFANLEHFGASFETILKAARGEMKIRDEVAGLDSEITELLDPKPIEEDGDEK